jgi:alkylhydroperoxidase family enzyme
MTTEPRVGPLPVDVAREAAAGVDVPEYVVGTNVFRTLLVHPPLAHLLHAVLDPLLLNGTLDARLRELVVMRVAWVTGSVYEWSQHWMLAPMFGAPAEDLAAVRDWEASDRFGATDRAILSATDETLAGQAVSDATWDDLAAALPDETQRMELLVLIGGYQMLSGVLRSLRVPLDAGLEPWLPDGVSPPGRGSPDGGR